MQINFDSGYLHVGQDLKRYIEETMDLMLGSYFQLTYTD